MISLFNINLQLFGGGGSKSGLGGGRGGGDTTSGGGNADNKGNPLGYIVQFYDKDGKTHYQFVRGGTPNQAEERAEQFGKKKGWLPSTTIGKRVRKNDADAYYKELRQKVREKHKK